MGPFTLRTLISVHRPTDSNWTNVQIKREPTVYQPFLQTFQHILSWLFRDSGINPAGV